MSLEMNARRITKIYHGSQQVYEDPMVDQIWLPIPSSWVSATWSGGSATAEGLYHIDQATKTIRFLVSFLIPFKGGDWNAKASIDFGAIVTGLTASNAKMIVGNGGDFSDGRVGGSDSMTVSGTKLSTGSGAYVSALLSSDVKGGLSGAMVSMSGGLASVTYSSLKK
ncbi:hypothetical protein GPK34_06835 [Secundilactobacillus kimchicus]|uniref:hypothetical protein n=1 Tax=Secundilactobacillus kimchicus TaxID=528209 RepID=UPI001C01988B|nr:hypothetical protein [Secundilactobacillus kimchicus]MBT9671744.1 hypothetical protein [Secundilactobacillus kimchicus]